MFWNVIFGLLIGMIPAFSFCKESVAVVIDSYSAANHYPISFREKGLPTIHIQTTKEILPIFQKSFRADLYRETLTYNGDLSHLMDSLEKYDVKCVIAGLDPAVELGDQLSSALGLRTNTTELSAARRNKFAMGSRLQEAGLPTPQFCKISDFHALLAWKKSASVQFPIVLKPLDSGGTDGVYICHNLEELYSGFHRLIGAQNVLGGWNRELLAQSYLVGDEYVVNSVSVDGSPYIVGVIESRKRFVPGFGSIYDRQVMLDWEGPIQAALIDMHSKILKALKLNNGPAHGEYMMTKEGPVLIEIAARISGGVHIEADNASVGCNQIDMTVDAYVDPIRFRERTITPYQRKKHFYQVFLTAEQAGIASDPSSFINELKKLDSFFDLKLKITEGQAISKTVDLISSLGSVYLVHEKEEVVLSDYEQVVRLTPLLLVPK